MYVQTFYILTSYQYLILLLGV